MKSNPPLPRNKQVDAISWAASKAGTSYGKYMLTLTDKQKQKNIQRLPGLYGNA